MSNTFFHDLRDLEPDDEATQELVTLPTLPDDPTPTVTLTDGKLIIARVRIGSIVHRLMLARGYRVLKS